MDKDAEEGEGTRSTLVLVLYPIHAIQYVGGAHHP